MSAAEAPIDPAPGPDLVCPTAAITVAERWAALGRSGATVWLTGLPASGKSTLAGAVEERLVSCGRPAFRLDGDEIRSRLCCDLGFDEASRAENMRRVAEVARILAEAGTIALVSLVSPFRKARAHARALHEQAGLPFFEIWLATPLAECERRDPKGLYRRARCGEVKRMTGVDDRYEPPRAPELVVTPDLGLPRATDLVLELIEEASERPAATVAAAGELSAAT